MLSVASLIILFTLNFQAFASVRGFEERLHKVDCSQFLTEEKIPENPGQPPKEPAFLTHVWNSFHGSEGQGPSLDALKKETGALLGEVASLLSHSRAVVAYNAYLRELDAKKKILLEDWRRVASTLDEQGGLDIGLVHTAMLLNDRAKVLIESASGIHQLNAISDYVNVMAEELREISNELVRVKARAYESLEGLSRTKIAESDVLELRAIINRASHNVRVASSSDEVQGFVEEARAEVLQLANVYSGLREKQAREELRFSVDAKNNSRQILDVFYQFEGGRRPDEELASNSIVEKMENNHSVKAFVVEELQILRRMQILADQVEDKAIRAEVLKGIAIRFANDQDVLLKLVRDVGVDNPVLTLRLVRQSLLRLNGNMPFRGLAAPGALRKRLNLFEREMISRDALRSRELTITILAASLELLPSVQPPQMKAQEPSQKPPVKERHARADYEDWQQWQEWVASWQDYAKELLEYRDTRLPEYKAKMAKLQAAHVRRIQARQSYLAYLVFCHPDYFADSRIPQRLTLKLTDNLDAALARLEAEQPALFETLKGKMVSLSSANGLSAWTRLYYVQNPIALAREKKPFFRYLKDLASYSIESEKDKQAAQKAMGIKSDSFEEARGPVVQDPSINFRFPIFAADERVSSRQRPQKFKEDSYIKEALVLSKEILDAGLIPLAEDLPSPGALDIPKPTNALIPEPPAKPKTEPKPTDESDGVPGHAHEHGVDQPSSVRAAPDPTGTDSYEPWRDTDTDGLGGFGGPGGIP